MSVLLAPRPRMLHSKVDRNIFKVARGSLDPFGNCGFTQGWSFSPVRLLADYAPASDGYQPRVDVVERPSAYSIEVELPGFVKEDVEIKTHEGLLTIRGEKATPAEEENVIRYRTERRYGSFSRTFRLPSDAREEQVKARFKDGILIVEVQKEERAGPVQVEITS